MSEAYMEFLGVGDNCAYLFDVLCGCLYAFRVSREGLGELTEAEGRSEV